jgi:hypothetical protein
MTASGGFKVPKAWLDGKTHVVKPADVQGTPGEFAAQLYAWAAEHDRVVHVAVDADGSVTLRFE